MKNKVAYLGIFLALALICSYVEALLPITFGIPGIKLGLANIVIVFAIYRMGLKEAFLLDVLRVLLVGFLFGNAFSIFYAMAGALLSYTAMALLYKSNKFQPVSVSLVGGIMHNLGQLLVAFFLVKNANVFYYFVVLLISGAVTGLLIGIISTEILLRVRKNKG